ncbi:MAG: DUF2752 domain-containing protein [Acidobacteria bacterium]|nr:DUF2752 domain-containing protein [Acidobacteriota bacterium]
MLARWRLPELCLSKLLLQQECPGCGLGRSTVAAFQGDIALSRALHPAGVAFALLVVAQVLARAWLAWRAPSSPRWAWWDAGLSASSLAALSASVLLRS